MSCARNWPRWGWRCSTESRAPAGGLPSEPVVPSRSTRARDAPLGRRAQPSGMDGTDGPLVDGAQLPLDGLQVRADLGIVRPERLDLANRAHDRGVVAVAEGAPQLGERALQPLFAEVHRHVAGESDALV